MSQVIQEHREEQMVVFRLSQEFYGLSIHVVQEIVTWREVTHLPDAPGFVEGIINLPGKVIPVINLSKRIGLAPSRISRTTRIVVVEMEATVAGLIVDEVSEVLRLSRDLIDPPERILAGAQTTMLRGVAKVGDRLILAMDPATVLAQSKVVLQDPVYSTEGQA